MSASFSRAPHIEGPSGPPHPSQAPNAALLIDFDNVTMGMRSDLSKELKTLLGSDVIRGKVTVQRAYADWRRYPQYIVPLSEASIDLIFAPAYGSSKKNATDIRMAIDGMELVFTRPEIGTYILLTGDSDFSSLVLKLKEYGKYVIGVGIQESSSDILVQNCDEYYSYTSLSGLRKTDETGAAPSDPWVLVEKAAEQMTKRGDVMRSDRLKQVMLEMDSGFDEKSFGFSKFSRFLSEAVRKGLIQTQKLENGQFEILPARGAKKADERRSAPARDDGREPKRSERGRPDRQRSRAASSAGAAPEATPAASEPTASPETSGAAAREGLAGAYDLLRRAIADLLDDQDSDAVRDSDVKRRMLALESGFDEGALGFSKFSRFLRQAHDHEIVDLRKEEGGNYQVALGARTAPPSGGAAPSDADSRAPAAADASTAREPRAPAGPATRAPATSEGVGTDAPDREEKPAASGRLRPREAVVGSGTRGGDPPPLFEGQVVVRSGRGAAAPTAAKRTPEPGGSGVDPSDLRLPTGKESTVQYLTNSYAGVGKKTAETLVDALGESLFTVLQEDPARVEALLPPARAEKVLEGWRADYQRRRQRYGTDGSDGPEPAETPELQEAVTVGVAEDDPRTTGRRGRRTRGGDR